MWSMAKKWNNKADMINKNNSNKRQNLWLATILSKNEKVQSNFKKK